MRNLIVATPEEFVNAVALTGSKIPCSELVKEKLITLLARGLPDASNNVVSIVPGVALEIVVISAPASFNNFAEIEAEPETPASPFE